MYKLYAILFHCLTLNGYDFMCAAMFSKITYVFGFRYI